MFIIIFVIFFLSLFDCAGSSLLSAGFLQWGPLSVVLHRLPIAVASLVAEHGLQGLQASVVVTPGSRAQVQ